MAFTGYKHKPIYDHKQLPPSAAGCPRPRWGASHLQESAENRSPGVRLEATRRRPTRGAPAMRVVYFNDEGLPGANPLLAIGLRAYPKTRRNGLQTAMDQPLERLPTFWNRF